MHKILYSYNVRFLYMFRAVLCSSSGGQIVCIQHMVSSLSMSGRGGRTYTGWKSSLSNCVELARNVMAHAQKPHFVFRLNGRVHLNRRGSQFSRLLAAEVCASAVVMLDITCSEVVWDYWQHTPFASFPFISPPVCHRVPPHSERSIMYGHS